MVLHYITVLCFYIILSFKKKPVIDINDKLPLKSIITRASCTNRLYQVVVWTPKLWDAIRIYNPFNSDVATYICIFVDLEQQKSDTFSSQYFKLS